MLTSPVARWLFAVGKFREIQGSGIDIFHSVVMKLFWIVQRGRPDCATATSYLCAITNQPDIEYCKKLKMVLYFMNNKIDNERIIGINNLH